MKPTQPVVPTENVGDLLAGMAKTGFQGRRLGESVEVWAGMIRDPECTIFLGLSGAMIPAGMQKVLIELAHRNYFDGLVSTGANILLEGPGLLRRDHRPPPGHLGPHREGVKRGQKRVP